MLQELLQGLTLARCSRGEFCTHSIRDISYGDRSCHACKVAALASVCSYLPFFARSLLRLLADSRLFALPIASTSWSFFIKERPLMSSFFATSIR